MEDNWYKNLINVGKHGRVNFPSPLGEFEGERAAHLKKHDRTGQKIGGGGEEAHRCLQLQQRLILVH